MRADRLLQIMLLLRARGKLTAQALADELEVSRRTILRDIDALSTAGVPIYADGGHGGGITLDEHYRVSLNGLQATEVRALFLSQNSDLLDEIGLGGAAESTLLKLCAALPALHRQAVEHVRARIHMDPVWWWRDAQAPPFWDTLQSAVDNDTRIRVDYRRFDGERVERELEPYSLVAKGGVWYLVARRNGEFRTYRVSRLHAVTLLDGRFQREQGFDLAGFWQTQVEAFRASAPAYAFTLRVHNRRLAFVQWYTPGHYQIEESDAGDHFTVHMRVESLDVARMVVLGLGVDAAVVTPDELRVAARESLLEQLNHAG